MAAAIWLGTYPDSVPFWIDNDTGRRICALIDDIWRKAPDRFDRAQTLRNDVDQFLAALVRIGVSDAARLEQALLATSAPDKVIRNLADTSPISKPATTRPTRSCIRDLPGGGKGASEWSGQTK